MIFLRNHIFLKVFYEVYDFEPAGFFFFQHFKNTTQLSTYLQVH